jgi:hypothetical protein
MSDYSKTSASSSFELMLEYETHGYRDMGANLRNLGTT